MGNCEGLVVAKTGRPPCFISGGFRSKHDWTQRPLVRIWDLHSSCSSEERNITSTACPPCFWPSPVSGLHSLSPFQVTGPHEGDRRFQDGAARATGRCNKTGRKRRVVVVVCGLWWWWGWLDEERELNQNPFVCKEYTATGLW